MEKNQTDILGFTPSISSGHTQLKSGRRAEGEPPEPQIHGADYNLRTGLRIEKSHRHLYCYTEYMAAGLLWLGESWEAERDLFEVQAQRTCGWQNTGVPKMYKS